MYDCMAQADVEQSICSCGLLPSESPLALGENSHGCCYCNDLLLKRLHLCAADDCFWAHEWSCHGSCSGWNQHDYFSNVISLHNDNDIAVRPSLSCRLQIITHRNP